MVSEEIELKRFSTGGYKGTQAKIKMEGVSGEWWKAENVMTGECREIRKRGGNYG